MTEHKLRQSLIYKNDDTKYKAEHEFEIVSLLQKIFRSMYIAVNSKKILQRDVRSINPDTNNTDYN